MSILIAPFAFFLAALLHGLVMRVPMRMDSVRRFLLVGVPLGLALVAFAWNRLGITLHGIAVILLYALLCELYMFLFTLVISSISVTMLILLRTGPINVSALCDIYDPQEMVKLRIGRLVRTGFIARNNGQLTVTGKGMKLHGVFASLERFFIHNPK